MISVIIPTRNRADLIGAAIASCSAQQLPLSDFEILVVDNGSVDQTAAVVRGWTDRLINLSYFHEAAPGLHVGRHRGMLEAKGDVLVFADDDIEATPSWLSTIHNLFQDPDVAMVGGNNLPLFLDTPPEWLSRLWNRKNREGGRSLPSLSILDLPEGTRPLSPYMVWGCNFAIRREVLLKAGGFHPDGMPKDLIRFRGDGETHVSRYVAEQGLKCLFHSGASVYHKVTPVRMTIAYFRQRGFSQGVSDSYTRLRGEVSEPPTQHALPYRAARWVWHRLLALRERLDIGTGAARALAAVREGYLEGYAYHQNAYRTDPAVSAWVHRKRYF